MSADWHYDPDVHLYRLGPKIIPGSTDVLKDAGFAYPPGNMEMGRAVHIATHYDDERTLDMATVTDDVYGYLMAWRKFREETGFKPDRIEEPNVNVALSFGAVLDREGTWNRGKRRVLVEIKKYAPGYFTGLQLALQDLTLPAVTLPRDRVAVHLMASGDYAIIEYKDPNERNLAMALVSLYWYKRNHGG
jgi:hypothetical protein